MSAPDTNLTAAWLAFLTPIMTAGLIVVNLWIGKRAASKAEIVAQKVDRVAEVTATTAHDAQLTAAKSLIITENTHTLVNSQYGLALALILEKATRVYELSHTDTDHAEMVRAREKLTEHEAKQHVVDISEERRK